MLLPVLPLPIVFPAVWPGQDALAVLLVLHVLSLELPPIGPCEGAHTMHPVVVPLASVHPAVGPTIGACALDVVVHKLTFEVRAVGPGEPPVAMLLAALVVAD